MKKQQLVEIFKDLVAFLVTEESAHVGKAIVLETDLCFGSGGVMEVERISPCILCSGW